MTRCLYATSLHYAINTVRSLLINTEIYALGQHGAERIYSITNWEEQLFRCLFDILVWNCSFSKHYLLTHRACSGGHSADLLFTMLCFVYYIFLDSLRRSLFVWLYPIVITSISKMIAGTNSILVFYTSHH